ncbi:MAG: PHP domain-containing protein [Candidatus Sumerlaeia bacterium]|nr:PHP domain-containing protein [Candidatus Sumerlaeia bacterium]
MSQIYADLHSHSNASDGSDRPAEVVRRAKAAGLAVLALTDHDTVAGVAEAMEEGRRQGVKVIAGTELTCYVDGREVHVLGYGIRIDDPDLAGHCTRFQKARIERAAEIGRRLAEAGAPIDIESVMAEADGGVVGRPHVARALHAAGHVSSVQEAFNRFLAEGKPANVHKLQVTAEECVDVIRKAGGIAVMAHPGLNNQFELVERLQRAGAVGVEVWHSSHDRQDTEKLEQIANDRGLLKTGGSDCHGTIKNMDPILGQWGVDKQRWLKLEKALAETS